LEGAKKVSLQSASAELYSFFLGYSLYPTPLNHVRPPNLRAGPWVLYEGYEGYEGCGGYEIDCVLDPEFETDSGIEKKGFVEDSFEADGTQDEITSEDEGETEEEANEELDEAPSQSKSNSS
jgi:hypothetical protein